MFEIKDLDACKKIWLSDNPDTKARIERDINANRKSNCTVTFIKDGTPITNATVLIKQQSHDFKYGANIFMLDEFDNEEDNLKYRELFAKYFNLATVPFYWQGIEPEEGKTRYEKGSPKIYRRPAPDLCIEYCNEKNISPKLHCLIYESFTPAWLPKNDEKAMEALYHKRFKEIADRYSGKMWEFEVMNELLQSHAWADRKSVIMGKRNLIKWGFDLAREYFPNETLAINEANPVLDIDSKKYFSPYFQLVENALNQGAKIDRIGLQHHLFAGALAKNQEEYENHILRDKMLYGMADQAKILNALDTLSEFGLPLEITEITIPTFGESEKAEEMQAELFERLYSAWFSHSALDGVVYWNVPDNYAWVNPRSAWNENNCLGGILRHDLTPKKSADMLYHLFNEKWHTEFTSAVNGNGAIAFNGFQGEYEAEINGKKYLFGIHKNSDNNIKIDL